MSSALGCIMLVPMQFDSCHYCYLFVCICEPWTFGFDCFINGSHSDELPGMSIKIYYLVFTQLGFVCKTSPREPRGIACVPFFTLTPRNFQGEEPKKYINGMRSCRVHP